MKVVSFAGLATIAYPLLCCSTAIAQDKVNWSVGTIFSYVEQDGWKKDTGKWDITVVSKDADVSNLLERNGEKETTLKASSGGVYTRPMPSGSGTFDYAPVKLPLVAGSEWDWVYHYIGKNTGSVGRASRKCEAIAIEAVEVPAGKFDAWKITCRGSWSSMAGSSGSITKTMWYAPSVAVVVKSHERSTYSGGSDQFVVTLVKLSNK